MSPDEKAEAAKDAEDAKRQLPRSKRLLERYHQELQTYLEANQGKMIDLIYVDLLQNAIDAGEEVVKISEEYLAVYEHWKVTPHNPLD